MMKAPILTTITFICFILISGCVETTDTLIPTPMISNSSYIDNVTCKVTPPTMIIDSVVIDKLISIQSIETDSSIIPSTYYSSNYSMPDDIYTYMESTTWIDEFESGAWDCSMMSAYIQWELENCGYNCVICVSDKSWADGAHAWILVEFEEGWIAYESTYRFWVFPDEETMIEYGGIAYNPSMYTPEIQYESIDEIFDDYGEEIFIEEWAWWI